MKKLIGLIASHILMITVVIAQQNVREQVYVHVNSQMLIPGETLYFSAYCNSWLTGQPSELSKILYVEIVGENGPIHQQKVYLEGGRGNSDFFVSSLIPTGRYYLIAYTRWMKNFDDYFQCPMLIVNPYEQYPVAQKPEEPDIEFFPLHDPLVAGLENVVTFHLKAKDPSNYKGRIVDGQGTTVSTFAIGKSGLGKLKFIPQKGDSYQLLLEDAQGKILFFDFPEVAEEGCFVSYREDSGQGKLKCEWAGKASGPLSLTLFSKGDVYHRSEVMPNEEHTVPADILSHGIFHVQYAGADGEVVAERSVLVAHPALKAEPIVKTYGARQKVTLETELATGSYSVSVRRKGSPGFDYHHHAIWSGSINQILRSPVSPVALLAAGDVDAETLLLISKERTIKVTPRQVGLLPEVREEILAGKITDSVGNPARQRNVALTFPGKQFQLRIGESDIAGNFFIPFQSPSYSTEAVLTALDFQNEYSIQIQSRFLDQYPDFDFQLPYLESSAVKEIIEKNIRVQIENAYFIPPAERPTSNEWNDEIPFHTTYLLDDYKRFPTLKETFTEYIVTANVRENRDHVIKTTYFPGLYQSEYPPLVLLDGVPVSGKKLIQLNPYKVESIGILPNRYFLGPLIIDGIVGVSTFDGDLGGFRLDLRGSHYKIPVAKLSQGHLYDFPDYSKSTSHHLADQRDQLYWNPDFRSGGGISEISFYTSDVPGDYEIVIEGFTKKGRPITRVYAFKVERDRM